MIAPYEKVEQTNFAKHTNSEDTKNINNKHIYQTHIQTHTHTQPQTYIYTHTKKHSKHTHSNTHTYSQQ